MPKKPAIAAFEKTSRTLAKRHPFGMGDRTPKQTATRIEAERKMAKNIIIRLLPMVLKGKPKEKLRIYVPLFTRLAELHAKSRIKESGFLNLKLFIKRMGKDKKVRELLEKADENTLEALRKQCDAFVVEYEDKIMEAHKQKVKRLEQATGRPVSPFIKEINKEEEHLLAHSANAAAAITREIYYAKMEPRHVFT